MLSDNDALFERLRKKPKVAWPTVILLLACLSIIVTVWTLSLLGYMNLWLGYLLNTVAMYCLFSPLHDSMHNSVFQNSKANSIFLFLSAFPIAPFSTGQFMRMMHMQHHRFTNDELDPDHNLSKSPWNSLSKWFVWSAFYYPFFEVNKDKYPEFSAKIFRYDRLSIFFMLIPLFFFPKETFVLYVLPVLSFSWLIAFVFMYLPHNPHTIKHKDDPYKATIIRQGAEWLLNPLMLYQNYHLVHHLYPTVPFYRYEKVWKAREAFHMSHNPSIVSPLQLRPVHHQ